MAGHDQFFRAGDLGPMGGGGVVALQDRSGGDPLADGHIEVLEVTRPEPNGVDIGARHEKGGQFDVADEQNPFQARPGSVPTLQGGADLIGGLVIQRRDGKQRDDELPSLGRRSRVRVQGGRDDLVEPGIHQDESAGVGRNRPECRRQRAGDGWRGKEIASLRGEGHQTGQPELPQPEALGDVCGFHRREDDRFPFSLKRRSSPQVPFGTAYRSAAGLSR